MHTHRRLHRQSLRQHPRALVQARITQTKLSKFQPSPVRRPVPQLRHAKARGKSKRDVETVSQGAAKSLKLNGIFRCPDAGGGLVYNEVAYDIFNQHRTEKTRQFYGKLPSKRQEDV